MKALTFENISFKYEEGKPLFENLSFNIKNPRADKGYISALMGPSGSGKTTLLKLILGTLNLESGKILTSPINPIISYIPQEPVLFDHLTPELNARYLSRISFYRKLFDNKQFIHLSNVLGMNGVFNRKTKVTDLSGGEKQRLMLLRALSIKPDFLLMDEPTTGLDSDVKLHFLNQVREIVLDQSILAIYVTHHKLETELIMDEIIYFDSNNSTGIDHVYQKDIETFMDTPPVLDAVSALNYPLVNLVRFSIGNDGYINACEAEAKESFIISLQPSITSFSKKGGIPIKLINTNHIFSLFEITGGQRIVLPTSQMHIGENLHLLVNGTINRYSESSSKHIDTIKIAMNKVVTNP